MRYNETDSKSVVQDTFPPFKFKKMKKIYILESKLYLLVTTYCIQQQNANCSFYIGSEKAISMRVIV